MAHAILAKNLSQNAKIYVKNDEEFTGAAARWSQYKAPCFATVVEVATENDIVETIRYANAANIPYLAYSGGHGTIEGLETIRNGIQISLTKLDSVSISETGETATFGGGIISKKVTEALWEAGKQTVTGCCESTSLLGPGLGGGHGFLQGKYGLISDQFVSARIVLANGTVEIVSANSNDPDLWWALQGAGHNFGIVSSITMKVYDIANDDIWSYENYIFSDEKVERLYELINMLWPDGSQSSGLVNFSMFLRDPTIDEKKPLIIFFILQNGHEEVEPIYTQPFRDLGSIFTQSGSGPYKDLPLWTAMDEKSPVNRKIGLSTIRFPVHIRNYNPQAQREVYDYFTKETSETPDFSSSLVMFEGYSVIGVKAIPSESAAFPHRDDNLLIAPVIVYDNKGEDPELDAKAIAFGQKCRQIIFAASGQKELHAYVNYASGNEKRETMYGFEPWRLQKLARLKNKYDPEGKFSYYASVI